MVWKNGNTLVAIVQANVTFGKVVLSGGGIEERRNGQQEASADGCAVNNLGILRRHKFARKSAIMYF